MDNDFYDCTNKDLLGSGAFGKIFSIDDKTVIKEYKIDDEWSARNCLMEILILKKLNHQNIIKCTSFFINKDKHIFQLLLEKCEFNLNTLISNRKIIKGKFNIDEIKSITIQIISGIAYLNSYNLIHCDIKPQNILIKDNIIKIIDFGLTDFEPEFKLKNFNSDVNNLVYTDNYASPEVLNDNYFSKKSDTWAIGCILFELLSLNSLFSCIEIKKTHRNEIKKKINNFMNLDAKEKNDYLISKIKSEYDNELYNLLLICLMKKELRPTAEEMYNYKVFDDYRLENEVIKDNKIDYKNFFIDNNHSLEKFCDKLQNLVFENEIINILISL